MKRLDEIITLVSSQKGIIDVGTDHGYIPVHFARTGYHGNLIASDINEGPLSAAKKIAATYSLADHITFTLADGLAKCDPNSVDTVIIAGMGGDLICSILDAAEWTMSSSYQLILQPMTKAEILRYWLISNGYKIEDERIAAENHRIFKIFSARFTGRNTVLKDAELYTGQYSLMADNSLFGDLLALETERMEKKFRGIMACNHTPGEEAFYRRILVEMAEMRKKYDEI